MTFSPRQYDIFKAIQEDVNPKITKEEIMRDYPSTPEQPRKKRKTSSKTKRKSKKQKGCGCK
jgi:hypothetical protein